MIPGSRRFPGEGIGYPLQYSGLENSINGIVHEVAKSWTQLSDFHFRERMKQIGQSRSDTQLSMCLVVKVEFNAVNNNIAQEPGNLGPRIKVDCTWLSKRWQE